MNTCFQVANYFLKCQDLDAGDSMSNLKLQKLVYYAQGFHLAIIGTPLFEEPIEAWEHGPVCPVLYQKYKKYKARAIPIPFDEETWEIFTEKTREVLAMVYRYYGQFSAWKLRDFTHEDIPWKNAHRLGNTTVITHKDMSEYFKTQLEDDEE